MSTSQVDLHEFLRSRRSVRQYLDQPIPPAVIERILTTAIQAPSAHNRQPWRFAVLTTAEAKASLADSMGTAFEKDLLGDGLSVEAASLQVSRSRKRILDAPATVILCLTMEGMDSYPDRRRRRAEFRMAMQSVALAGGQLLLAAHSEGIGGVWVCAPLFAPDVVRAALELPEDWEPQGMLLLGYPDPEQPPRKRSRRPVAEVSVYR